MEIFFELAKKVIIGLWFVLLILLIFMFYAGRCSKDTPEQTIRIDTVFVDKPIQLGGTLTPATVVVAEEDEDPVDTKPLPAITKYKVTDWVCAWGKWSGVVTNVHWSERNPDSNVLVYKVQHYNEETEEWYENGYYESELEPGKCN